MSITINVTSITINVTSITINVTSIQVDRYNVQIAILIDLKIYRFVVKFVYNRLS
jgi:hypothetical protein